MAIYSEAMFLFGIEQINVGVMRKNLEWINYGVRQDEFNHWGIRPDVHLGATSPPNPLSI